MPKAVLEFNLPEENDEFETAYNGINYKIILSELDNYLRSRLKYEELSEPIYEALQATRDELSKLVREENLDI